MDLVINGFSVKIEIVSFEGNKGFILIILPKNKKKEAIANLSEVSEKLQQCFYSQGGIMDNLDGDGKEQGGYQLRLLEVEPLMFIDMVRALGYSVRQEVILKRK